MYNVALVNGFPKSYIMTSSINPVKELKSFSELKQKESFLSLYKYLFNFHWFYLMKYFIYFSSINANKLNLTLIKLFYLLTSKLVIFKRFPSPGNNIKYNKKQIFYV